MRACVLASVCVCVCAGHARSRGCAGHTTYLSFRAIVGDFEKGFFDGRREVVAAVPAVFFLPVRDDGSDAHAVRE